MSEAHGKTSSISDLATMLQVYTRLFHNIQTLPAFTGPAGFTEWLLLRMLTDDPKLKAGGLSGMLGISPQRAAQMLAGLRKGGYVEASADRSDPRKHNFAVTSKGLTLLSTIDQAVLLYFGASLVARPKALSVITTFGRGVLKQNPTKQSISLEINTKVDVSDSRLPTARD